MQPQTSPDPADGAPPLIRAVLLVDDSRLQRRILRASLERWGYRVLECGTGEEALDICRTQPVDLIISDWIMPGMSGLDFCRAFRALERESYGYFILLTSKSETGEMVNGLDNGADEFLTKPVNASELRARIASGERILRMERELRDKNRLVSHTLSELQSLYDAIDRDLAAAEKLQQSLVSERSRRFGRAWVSLLMQPAGRVGGDLVGYFPAGPGRLGLFAVDVSGHGISAAMVTARLAGLLSSPSVDQNLALAPAPDGGVAVRPPEAVVADLNGLLLDEIETEHYFTLLLAVVDLDSGAVRYCQAGHPHPVVQRASGGIEVSGRGGLPVGLLPGAEFEGDTLHLAPGDRVLIASDGLSECAGPNGAQLGDAGVIRILGAQSGRSGPEALDAILAGARDHAGSAGLADDISAVLLEFS
ncbi:PP2C family protein-serine/threonine phosphatase [Rhodovulum adriaticum]|uniref:Sigma-B regulation protein RsbU (Phosphoserine phosphatase) n=1 Tax=Rhodovulum adriaticum TaxID=35804 RepID=A0A4R2NYX7_RHOAD|nr:SpoIIE family protein phosphatase [Rhodovulum adriaticum]TCP27519.1 sigma-B regulation protein RsbU (phosphoserine phosphatase) [Rhodovulum adriaticum]